MRTPPAAEIAPVEPRRSTRLRLLGALAVDLALLAGIALLGLIATAAWLLPRSEAGLLDVTPQDGATALAVAAAALPAWAAAQLWALAVSRRTAGGALMRLPPEMPPADAILRGFWLLLHPAAGPLWLWAGATVGLLAWIVAAPVLALVGLLVLLLGAASLVALLLRPGGDLFHTRLLRSFVDDGGR